MLSDATPIPRTFGTLLLAQMVLDRLPNHMRTLPLLTAHQQKPPGHAPLPHSRARKGTF